MRLPIIDWEGKHLLPTRSPPSWDFWFFPSRLSGSRRSSFLEANLRLDPVLIGTNQGKSMGKSMGKSTAVDYTRVYPFLWTCSLGPVCSPKRAMSTWLECSANYQIMRFDQLSSEDGKPRNRRNTGQLSNRTHLRLGIGFTGLPPIPKCPLSILPFCAPSPSVSE